jgi:hypothetical protein
MGLRDLLAERKEALCGRWLDAVLGEYGEQTAVRWRKERDPFANPIGHALATGLPALLGAVAGDGEPDAGARAALEGIVRIRSVQSLTPSRAVGFVGLLRGAIRAELSAELAGGGLDAELAEVDGRIEQLVLLAFDAYMAAREQVFRVRQEELKRSVGSLLRRWYGGVLPEAAAEGVVQLSPPPGRGVRR